MADYSNESANNTCQHCQHGQQKIIYLTFDDGPEPGTMAVYEALKSVSVPATFFFVGENVLATEDGTFEREFEHWGLNPGLFNRIFNDPLFQIGTHSQTQSHQFYASYYKIGLRIDPTTLKPSATSEEMGRRSVLVDFELSSMAFSYAMAGVPQQYVREMFKIKDYGFNREDVAEYFKEQMVEPYFRFLTARLPGTNRWRIPSNTKSEWEWMRGGTDRDAEANIMYANKYKIFGWDIEWKFTGTTREDGKSQMSVDINQEHRDGKDGWWKYYEENILEDRPKQSVDAMVEEASDKLKSWSTTKDMQVVMLMHDRQFRPGAKPGEPEYTERLLEFVNKCKAQGYTFDVLENYKV